MVKIQRMVKIRISDGFHPALSPHFRPNGQDLAQICSKISASNFEVDGTTWYRRIESSWVSLDNIGNSFHSELPL